MTFLLTLIGGLVFQLLLPPWWVVLVPAFGAGLGWGRTGRGAFWQGFGAVALLWGGYAAWLHVRSGGILTERVAVLFQGLPPLVLVVLAAVLGGLAAGLAALSGYYLRLTFRRRPSDDNVCEPT